MRLVTIRTLSGGLTVVCDENNPLDKYVRKEMQGQREGEILSRIHHENIVKLIRVDGKYLVMELVDDMDLIEWCACLSGTPSLRTIQIIARQLMRALIYLREVHVIHRDVKPDNVIIQKSTNRIKLVDFGLACYEDEVELVSWNGTLRYMAPETFSLKKPSHERFSHKNDVYGAGLTIYAIATDDTPLKETTSNLHYLLRLDGFDFHANLIQMRRNLWMDFHNEILDNWFKHCTAIDVDERYDANQAFAHRFLTSSA